jgi:hypothetical protein
MSCFKKQEIQKTNELITKTIIKKIIQKTQKIIKKTCKNKVFLKKKFQKV